MTKAELIKELEQYPDDMQIALRAKDDYLLTKGRINIDKPYFGNCDKGRKWEENNLPLNEDGDLDYDKTPDFIILVAKWG